MTIKRRRRAPPALDARSIPRDAGRMSKIVNLRQARKAKARAQAAKTAAENRATFGRTKAERALKEAEEALARGKLDAHKRDREERDET